MSVIHTDADMKYWASNHWLGHCKGFRVDNEDGKLGVVDHIVGDEDEPEELIVRSGLFVSRCVSVPVDAIRAIEPRAKRIRVCTDGERVS